MSYETTLEYIHKTKWTGSKPTLSRIHTLLEKLGRPDRKLKFIHVAGTNAKGSVSAFVSTVLQSAGYKTGLFTSPYIIRFNERFKINSESISDAELERITDIIRPLADSMTDDPPTEFELITAIAFEYFAQNGCDIVVLETGMGGLLDSTNVIDAPECAVLTKIGLDHTKQLGDTVEKIAETKAGIIKTGCDVVIYDEPENILNVIHEKCVREGCTLHTAEFNRLHDIRYYPDFTEFSYLSFKNLRIRLLGTYQVYNAALSVKCLAVLRDRGYLIPDSAIYSGLENTVWQGRFELLGKNPAFILDGSHNPQGISAALESLKQYFPNKKYRFLLGFMTDKDTDTMLKLLVPYAQGFVAVKPDNPRAMDEKELCERLLKAGANAVSAPSVFEGVKILRDFAKSGDVCAALGSLYFSNEVRQAYYSLSGKQDKA